MTGKIKIVSGWTAPGGSTVAFINLVNEFNKRGMEAILYGPHDWHLSKCKSEKLEAIQVTSDDSLIVHFLGWPPGRPITRRFIYSCHETNLTPLSSIDMSDYDLIHYVSDSQRLWHNVNYDYKIIPNIISDLKKSPLKTGRAAVIGSIDQHKQTHLSIERAIDDGYYTIFLYGSITDKPYYEKYISPLELKFDIRHVGFIDDKQKMYDSVDAVYHSSRRETFNYIKYECEATGVEYNGYQSSESGAIPWSTDKIIEAWKEIL